MKTIFKIILSTFLIFNISCKKEDVILENEQLAFFLDSKIEDGITKGFRLESNQIIDYPNSDGIKPDFIVAAQVNDTGLIIGPFLSNPDLNNIFILTEEFSELDSAKLFYNSYNYSDDSIFEQLALDVKPYQIWTIKTENDLKGKLLILKTKGGKINNNTEYAEMEFFAYKLN
jgi:hypothetical protein